MLGNKSSFKQFFLCLAELFHVLITWAQYNKTRLTTSVIFEHFGKMKIDYFLNSFPVRKLPFTKVKKG